MIWPKSIYVERSAFLRDVHFLSHLSDYDIAKIANLAKDGKYTKHKFIVKEGDDGDTFFILTEGTCNVYQVDKAKKQVLVNQMNVGNGLEIISTLYYFESTVLDLVYTWETICLLHALFVKWGPVVY